MKECFSTLLILAACMVLMISCTEETPQIHEIQTQLINHTDQESGEITRFLELAVHCAGDDEQHQIERITVTAPEDLFLVWEINQDLMHAQLIDGELWISTGRLLAPASFGRAIQFPRGSYTLTLMMRNGLAAEQQFMINDPLVLTPAVSILFPRYDRAEDRILASSGASVRIRGFDAAMNPVGETEVRTDLRLAEQIDRIRDAMGAEMVFFELAWFDPVLKQQFRTGAYTLPED
jgi:hypothetical protein